MDREQKVQLRNLLKEYRKEYCDTAKVAARNWLTDKCDVCDFSTSSGCMADVIALKLENELWEG